MQHSSDTADGSPASQVVVWAPYYPPAFRAGGPVKSISSLVQSAGQETRARVVTRNWDLGSSTPLTTSADRWEDSDQVWRWGGGWAAYIGALRAAGHREPDVVYVNSLFDPWMALIPAIAWRLFGRSGSTLVIAPRGQLGEAALRRSGGKKMALLRVWRRLARRSDVVVHAATDEERAEVGRTLGAVHILVRSNEAGPLLAPTDAPPAEEGLRAVFLGRLVPIKGLLEMLESLRDVPVPFTLHVYGPEEDRDYVEKCRRSAASLPETVRVEFRGDVASSEVRRTLSGYDVMLNPTRGESFGQAIGESLSAGTPVAVAPVTPWTQWIEGSSGGWIVTGDRWDLAVARISDGAVTSRDARRRGARASYEAWWEHAHREPHIFDMVRHARS